MPRLDFILAGRDQLSRVLDRAGDSADRLGRRLTIASINGDMAMRRLANSSTRHLADLDRDSDLGAKSLDALKKAAISLAPAAIPAAASLAPIAAGAGAVAVASGVMVAAMIPQISAIGDASEAHKKYTDAVAKSGARSTEAVQAQIEYQRVMSQLPPKTREAAASVSVLKDETKAWSDGLAGDTMAPFIKGVSIANALLPKTSALVKGTSAEADRFMTILAGEMASPGLDKLNSKFTAFATGTLRKVNDEIVHLLRVADTGAIGGGLSSFMDWARTQGPAVASVLRSVGEALLHLLDAGADVGVGMLQVVSVLADLVSAVPASAIAMILQLAVALKLTKLAALGLAAGRTAIAGFATQILAMNTASAAAPGRLAAVRAGVAALSRTAKVAMAGTGIGLLLIALSEISSRSESAPPDVDKLTSSLRHLASTGKVTGEAAKAFGSDLSGLHDKVSAMTAPSNAEKIQQWIVTLGGLGDWDSTPVKEAKGHFDAIDKSLAALVSNGQADLAAAALKRLTAEYGRGGRDTRVFTRAMVDYKSKLADAKDEQDLAAAAMGIFGAQAQKTQAQLDAQKHSADGLRASIVALNDVNRSAYDAQISFEAGLDNLTAAFKKNGATLDISTEAGRNNGTAMSQAAKSQDELIATGLAAGDSLSSMTRKSGALRGEMMRLATDAFDGNRRKATAYVNTLLGTPGQIKTLVKLERQEAITGLEAVRAAIKRTPGAKTVKVDTLNGAAIKALEAVGLKTRQLPNGKTAVFTKNGQALGNISAVAKAINNLHDKTITLTSYSRFVSVGKAPSPQFGHLARGGRVRGYAGGGGLQSFPGGGYVDGPGTPTSDSIMAFMGSGAMARVSNTEFVMRGAAVKKYGIAFMNALNEGRLSMPGLAGGGMSGAGTEAGRGLAGGLGASIGMVDTAARRMAAAVTAGIKAELQIASPSKRTHALAKDAGAGLIKGLTGSKDKIKATAKDLAKDIWAAFSGSKDNRLVAYVNKQTKILTSLAGKRDSIAATIKRAKDFAESTRVGAKKSASLGGMFEGEEKVTAAGIASKLQARLAKMKTFSSYIKNLAKRGLNKTMLREILEMGPEEGYAYASALAGANSKLFKEINSTQYKINDQAEKLGRSGADALYDSGKDAGKGFLKGLTSQQKAIEDQMLKIAKGMQKAIKAALGIKSPSTVMAKIGRHTTEGLAVGLVDRMPVLDRALSSVSGRVAATRPTIGRPAVAGAGGGVVYHVHVEVHDAMDPIAVGKELQRVLVRLGRAQGATVDLKVG